MRPLQANPRAVLLSGIVALVLGAAGVAFGLWRIEWNVERGRPHRGWVRGSWAIAGGVTFTAIGIARLLKARRLRREAAQGERDGSA